MNFPGITPQSRVVVCDKFAVVPLYKNYLVITNNGDWAILNKASLLFYEKLQKEITIKDLARFMSDDESRIISALKKFYNARLIRIDEKIKEQKPWNYGDPIFNPIGIIVMRISTKCNLQCKYCLVELDDTTTGMTFETARSIIDKILEFPQRHFSIQFFGGEPLLKFKLIKQIVKYCESKSSEFDKSFTYILQTNGTLIDREKAFFLRKHKFKIGISLDGPPHINDRMRIFPNLKGSYKYIMRGMSILKKINIPFGIVCVLSKVNINRIEEVIQEFERLGIKEFKLNVVKKLGRGKECPELLITPYEYFFCMKKIFEIIVEKKGAIIEENLKYMVANILSPNKDYMCKRAPCGAGISMLAFDTDGSLFPCDSFIGMNDYRLSKSSELTNLTLGSIRAKHPKIKELSSRTSETMGCGNCEWKFFCGFDCPASNISVTGNAFHNADCDFYKLFFPYLFNKIDENPDVITYVLGDDPNISRRGCLMKIS